MKKSCIKYLIISCIATAVAGYMTACGGNRTPDLSTLSVPENVKFSIEYENNQTKWLLHWETVENAKGYEITVVETEKSYFVEEQASVYDLTSVLDKAGNYNLSIQAIGNGRNTEDSEKVTIEINAESVTESLEYTYDPKLGGYEISKGTADLKGRLVLPDLYEGEEVISIGESAFGFVRGLGLSRPQLDTISVRLPKFLITIKKDAFFYCEKLEEVAFYDKLESIEQNAFEKCKTLKTVNGSENLKSFGLGAFRDCESLSSVSISAEEVIIDDFSFKNCKNLDNLMINGSVAYMGENVFTGTKWYDNQPNGYIYIQNVLYGYKGEMPVGTEIFEFPSYITTMAGKAFYECKNLKSVKIPDGWTTIGGEHVFGFCKELEEVILPDGMEEIPRGTFTHCTVLETINTPGALKKIRGGAFYYCENLKDFEFNNGLEEICDSAFSGCKSIEEVVLPDSVKTVGQGVFVSCKMLSAVRLSKELETIPNSLFNNCKSLKSIIIPSKVKKIGFETFAYCENLETVEFEQGSQLESIEDGIFMACENLKEIIFNGTKEEWNSVSKHKDWNVEMPTIIVRCTDGDVTL